jgi:transposase-like protein
MLNSTDRVPILGFPCRMSEALMARVKQPKPIHQMTVAQWEKAFPSEDACEAYLVAHRWPNGVKCPRCGSEKVYQLQSKKWHWECPDCRQGGAYRFSDIGGTVFENTKVDLRHWFRVIHLMLTDKRGTSALQIQRYMGFGSYRTAWYMCRRIRAALVDGDCRAGRNFRRRQAAVLAVIISRAFFGVRLLSPKFSLYTQ